MVLINNKKQIALLLAISTLSGIITPVLMNVSTIESFAYSDINNLSEEDKEALDIKKIISGGQYTIFIKKDGTVWACGENNYGQLGIGNSTNQTTPVQVNITDVKDVSCGFYNTVFIKNDGTVWACGYNEYGQLGIGNTTNQTKPVQVNITDVKDVSCGNYYTMFLKNDGTVFASGQNSSGELGISNTTGQKSPVQVKITDVKKVITGGHHVFFIKDNDSIWSCGKNFAGQLGIGNTTGKSIPTQVNITDVKDIVCGNSHALFIKNDNTIWGTGANDYGQLGIGNTKDQTNPIQVPITNVKNISAGGSFTIFLKNDGTVWGTGRNDYGQLGIGNSTGQKSPVQTIINNVESINSGYYHSMFFKKDGTVWGCGHTGKGQLGICSTSTQLLPIQMNATLVNVSSLVLKAEQTKLQSDFDIAKSKVDALANSTEKTNLQNRLNILQSEINNIKTVTDLVALCENSKKQSDLDNALVKVNELPICSQKTDLLERLNLLQSEINNIKNAIIKVEKVELSLIEADFNIAQEFVNLLSDSDIKTELQNRLNIIKTQIIQADDKYNKQLQDSIDKIIKAESSKTNFDITLAQTAINGLKESDRISLQQRLNTLKEQIKIAEEQTKYNKLLQEATDKITKAESSKIDYDITVAQIAIDKLKPEDKSSLQLKIDNLKEQIRLEQEALNYNKLLEDATLKVAKSEETKNNYDIALAKEAINKLKDIDKTPLQDRIDLLEYNILLEDANLKVISAEELRTDTSISIAQVAVDKVPLREVSTFAIELVGKVQLQSKLDSLKLSIEEERYLKLLQEANDNVTNAENTKTLKDIKLAQMSIDRLKEIDKPLLQLRLDNLKALMLQEEKDLQDLKLATNKVEQAEGTKTQKDIDDAKILVNELKESAEKTSLLDRINAVEQIIITANLKTWIYQADVYVKQAEALKREPYITKAQTAIDKLPNKNPDKVLLQARLDKVKK